MLLPHTTNTLNSLKHTARQNMLWPNTELAMPTSSKKDYDDANIAFRKYTDDEKSGDKKRLSDAYNRIGDSYFVRRDFESSIPFYTKNIELDTYQQDYAAYQKALALGVMHDQTEKIDA